MCAVADVEGFCYRRWTRVCVIGTGEKFSSGGLVIFCGLEQGKQTKVRFPVKTVRCASL